MNLENLYSQIKLKQSFLCLGLDSDISKIPNHLLKENDPIFSFNKCLLDSLKELIVAVKINTAFYEANGSKGWITLEKTINYINQNYPASIQLRMLKEEILVTHLINMLKLFLKL